jgi:long-chain acyl-CoA synthetase
MNPYIVGVILPILATLIFRPNHPKRRGVPITDTSGESGVTIRNRRFDSPVETAWEGVSTLAELFEEACRKHGERFLLGTRSIISKETETSSDGRRFEKVEFGDYEWLSYADAFEDVLRFGSGLAALGHERNERAAIFADTREEWFLALQVRYHYCYSIICFF